MNSAHKFNKLFEESPGVKSSLGHLNRCASDTLAKKATNSSSNRSLLIFAISRRISHNAR